MVLRALEQLWNYRETVPRQPNEPESATVDHHYFKTVERLRKAITNNSAEALEKFAESATLDELVEAIKRDVEAGSPEAALDRLRTYCMKWFAHLLEQRGVNPQLHPTLDGRAGAYVNAIRRGNLPSKITNAVLKATTKILTKFNEVRNKQSLAHDNQLVSKEEGRFIFDSVVAFIRFSQSTERIALLTATKTSPPVSSIVP